MGLKKNMFFLLRKNKANNTKKRFFPNPVCRRGGVAGDGDDLFFFRFGTCSEVAACICPVPLGSNVFLLDFFSLLFLTKPHATAFLRWSALPSKSVSTTRTHMLANHQRPVFKTAALSVCALPPPKERKRKQQQQQQRVQQP